MKAQFFPLREFNTTPHTGQYLDDKGAATWLAGRIQSYWRRRGHKTVKVEVVPVFLAASPEASTSTVYAIRSNLVGGRPA